jgi:hypothetical protein
MNNIIKRPKPGEVWRTRRGFKVRVLAGLNSETVESIYVGSAAGGIGGARVNFHPDTLHSISDELVGRASK